MTSSKPSKGIPRTSSSDSGQLLVQAVRRVGHGSVAAVLRKEQVETNKVGVEHSAQPQQLKCGRKAGRSGGGQRAATRWWRHCLGIVRLQTGFQQPGPDPAVTGIVPGTSDRQVMFLAIGGGLRQRQGKVPELRCELEAASDSLRPVRSCRNDTDSAAVKTPTSSGRAYRLQPRERLVKMT